MRPLARPHEDLTDQGLGFDVDTLLNRRGMLRMLGIGAAAAGLAACSSPATTSAVTTVGEIPDEVAGPFPGDGSNGPDVLEQSGIVRSDIRSSFGEATGVADGVPLTLEMTILDLANGGVPFAGAAVYVWHCDRDGNYSMYSAGVENQNYLRGVQIVDGSGKVRYSSIFPACYPGRWPHIHFEVYPDQAGITDSANAIATSQIALPEDVCDTVYRQPGYEQSATNLAALTLDTDGIFADDAAEHQLATVTGDVDTGYTATLTVGVDTATAPTAGEMYRPDGAPMGPPPGAPPS
jgi:protocatechuate 3,4-dioxygenase beta subunit